MSTNNKSIRKNVIPATACASASTTTSVVEKNTWGSGIRFFVTVSGAGTAGALDSFFLCALPPGAAAVVPLVGFSLASMLSTNGVWCFDFYPSAALPSTVAAGGSLLGAAGIQLPMNWAARVIMGTGSSATVTVDAEILPS